jgi:hypothetical protein
VGIGERGKAARDGKEKADAQRLSEFHESPVSVVGQVALPAYRAWGFAFFSLQRGG